MALCYDLSEIDTIRYGDNDGGEGGVGKVIEAPGPDLFFCGTGIGIF